MFLTNLIGFVSLLRGQASLLKSSGRLEKTGHATHHNGLHEAHDVRNQEGTGTNQCPEFGL